MKYTCEFCGKTYVNQPDAESCEKSHEEEVKKEERRLAQEKDISRLINLYVKRYKKMPSIVIDDENRATAITGILNDITDIFSLH